MGMPIEKLKQLQEDFDKECKDMMIDWDMLQGNINHMMVTHDNEELLTMFAYAHKRLGDIFWKNKKRINMENMGRLPDADEVKKKYPLMENNFGMTFNERLHKAIDSIPTMEAIPKADYETHLKADMVAMLKDIQTEIEEKVIRKQGKE